MEPFVEPKQTIQYVDSLLQLDDNNQDNEINVEMRNPYNDSLLDFSEEIDVTHSNDSNNKEFPVISSEKDGEQEDEKELPDELPVISEVAWVTHIAVLSDQPKPTIKDEQFDNLVTEVTINPDPLPEIQSTVETNNENTLDFAEFDEILSSLDLTVSSPVSRRKENLDDFDKILEGLRSL